ncbi:MAG: TonB-dependent receptor [Bacteroidaceae bacterium]|nr:TonB-dependent receptor [Bacteroidaceae bacterium]
MRIAHFIIAFLFFQSLYSQDAQDVSSMSFDAKDIRERGIHDIGDIATIVPNLFVISCGSAQNTAIYLRGVGSCANTPAVGMYVDDMPWLEKSSFRSKIGEMERIEVLRGPQNMLYGRNTMAGLIRITTKNPIDYQGTVIERSMANHYSHYTSVSHYQRFSEKLGLAAGVAYRSEGQFFNHSVSGLKADADRSLRAHARLLYRPNDVASVDFLANYELCSQDAFPFYLESVPDDDLFKEQLSQEMGRITSNDDNTYLRHLFNVGVKAERNWSKVTLRNVLAFQLLNDDLNMDKDFTCLSLGTFLQQQHSHILSEEIVLKSQPAAWRHWDWITGVCFNGQWLHTCVDDVAQYDTPRKNAALYHQSALRDVFNAKGLDMTLGIRAEYEYAGFSYSNQSDRKVCADWWQLIPRASLQYSFPKGNVYGTVSRGSRSGGYNCLVLGDAPQLYRPEYAWNYEVGSHLQLVNNRLCLDASLFLINLQDQQIPQITSFCINEVMVNAGRSRSYGGEFSLRSQITDCLQAHATYGYTHATFVEHELSSGVSYEGNYVPFTPQHSVDLGASLAIPLPTILNRQLLDRMVISSNWHGMGKIYWTEDNLVSEPFYTALDARITFFRKNMEFAVWAANIYNSRCRTLYVQSMNRGYSQMNKPFRCGFEIKFHF